MEDAAKDQPSPAPLQQQQQQQQQQASWTSLAAGPIAGICSRFVVYPFDTIKARLQVQPHSPGQAQYRGTADAFVKIVRLDGAQGLYRGFLTVALGSLPGNTAYFGGYELGRALVPAEYGMAGDMAVGAVAQLIASVVFTPVDVVKERLQVQGVWGVARSSSSALQVGAALLRAHGPLGLMKGYLATNAVWIPWNMLFIAGYEQLKRSAAGLAPQLRASVGGAVQGGSALGAASGSKGAGQPEELPLWMLGLCSAGAASIAGLLTHPIDVVKTRLQVWPSAAAGSAQPTALGVAAAMYRQEGMKAFSRGALARVLVLAPGTALSWTIYEPVKRMLS